MNGVRKLVQNAARHSPPGSTVRALVELRQDEQVAVVVENDGHGVDPEERLVIFAPLRRSRAAELEATNPTSAGEGLGIGLAIAQRSG